MKVGKQLGQRPATQMRTVVLLAKAFPPVLGGVETYSEQVARAYLRAGLAVIVLTQTSGSSGWKARSTPDGELLVFNSGAGGQLQVFRRLLVAALSLRGDESKIVGVHSTTWRVGVVAEAVFRRLPRVVTVHGREVLNFPWGARSVMRWVLTRATVVLCVSNATRAAALESVRPSKPYRWHVAFNGLTTEIAGVLSPDHQPEIREGCTRLLSLNRLVARKNIETAVQAVSLLDPSIRSSIDYRIGGRGPEVERIQAAIQDLGLDANVSVLGFVADEIVPALYDWSEIFLHPHSHVGEGTDFEGFGIAIADAMAHGCAVISGQDGGPADFIVDGETGLLVDGNDPVAIAEALARLVSDQRLRDKMAQAAQEFARDNFSWDKHIDAAKRVMRSEARASG
jgi:phosphatidyl-myo-inositol dimannoside synthase